MVKTYVDVGAVFNTNGDIIPVYIKWEDGTKYKIDSVCDMRPAPALKAGGQGDRFTVLVNGKRSFLFYERDEDTFGKWFVERKTSST